MNDSGINRSAMLKNFAIGFLPLFIFIAADELYGTEVGLITAIISGMLYLVYYYWRHRQVEKMILLDTGLILAMGSVSLLLHNDIFFKLKPALVELILVLIVGVHAFSSNPILLHMQKRYVGDIELPPQQTAMLKQLSRILFIVLSLHTAAIVYTAWYSSKEVWAFVSGGLFYILFGLILAGQWIYMRFFARRRTTPHSAPRGGNDEMLDILDEKGRVLGQAPRQQVHGNPNLIHGVVHLHVVDKQNRLFLQKRSETKDLYPGLWDTAVGGHIDSGEKVQQALLRETREELGFTPQQVQPLFTYLMRNEWESELVHSFKTVHEGSIEPNPAEISEGRFWTAFEIEKFLGQNLFTPNFEQEFRLLRQQKIL